MESLFIRVDGELRQLQTDDILYVQGMKDYVMFYLLSQPRPLITHLTMKAVEDMLPTERFMRVHRSYIVALDKIRSIDRNDCIYIGQEIIHVTEAYREAFQHYISEKASERMNGKKDMVKGYVRYLKLQRGMSANTLDAYQRDLEKLLTFLKHEEKR